MSLAPKQEENPLLVHLFPDPGLTFHKHSQGSENKGKIARVYPGWWKKPFLKTLQTSTNQFSQFIDNKDRLRKIKNQRHIGAGRNHENLLGPTHCLLASECQNLPRQMRESDLLKNAISYRVFVQP